MCRIESSGDIAYTFISGRQKDDCDQGEDEREGSGDMPSSEDDAKVFVGPCEEHLEGVGVSDHDHGYNVLLIVKAGALRTYIHRTLRLAVVHMAVIHMTMIHDHFVIC